MILFSSISVMFMSTRNFISGHVKVSPDVRYPDIVVVLISRLTAR